MRLEFDCVLVRFYNRLNSLFIVTSLCQVGQSMLSSLGRKILGEYNFKKQNFPRTGMNDQ
jgi:hypothetical protein